MAEIKTTSAQFYPAYFYLYPALTMKSFYLIITLFFIGHNGIAQDSTKRTRRSFDSALFAENNTLTRSDYLVSLGKVFYVLNSAPVVTESFTSLTSITNHLNDDDSALEIIKERLYQTDRTLNLRNLQMFRTLLADLKERTIECYERLDEYDNKLDSLKKAIRDMRKDTAVGHIFRDSVLRASFAVQLKQLRGKWKIADSVIKQNTTVLINLKSRTSDNKITIEDLLYHADAQLKTIGPRAFEKERRYIWEPRTGRTSRVAGFKKSIESEEKIAAYYFANTHSQRYFLLLTAVLFFYWVFYNFRSLKQMNKQGAIDSFNFRYLNPLPVAASFIFMLNLAPLFDLQAPALYIESVQFLLMTTLTVIFWKHLPHTLFYFWGAFVILFLLLIFTRFFGLPFYLQRWWTLLINTLCLLLGCIVFVRYKLQLKRYKALAFSGGLYIAFQLLAIICNIFGRVTLMQIFGSTAIYAFAQTAGLMVFIQVTVEAFLLQIQSSRIRKNYPQQFESGTIAKNVTRFVTLFAIVLWGIVFTINLNIYTTLTAQLSALLTAPREVGSFSFTFGGVILFLGIIWVAHFLQKYIAYFFGDTGDDAAFDNKGERSRLLVTRLILLIAGFLLAVAASGLPVDKITVVLGALSVGIGLGLQSIVNNFVSGIILIFDRPLRIGDVVEIGDKKGRVKEIGIRSSTLLTPQGAEVIIPNGDVLSHNIVNWTLSNNHIREELSFSIERPGSVEETGTIIKETVLANTNVLQHKEPEILISTLPNQALKIKVYYWCGDISKTEHTHNDLYAAIYNRLQEQGIALL